MDWFKRTMTACRPVSICVQCGNHFDPLPKHSECADLCGIHRPAKMDQLRIERELCEWVRGNIPSFKALYEHSQRVHYNSRKGLYDIFQYTPPGAYKVYARAYDPEEPQDLSPPAKSAKK